MTISTEQRVIPSLRPRWLATISSNAMDLLVLGLLRDAGPTGASYENLQPKIEQWAQVSLSRWDLHQVLEPLRQSRFVSSNNTGLWFITRSGCGLVGSAGS